MAGGAGLRRIAYGGQDAAAEQAFRSVSDQLNYFGKIPSIAGVLLENLDFSGDASENKSHALNHQLNRKARGVSVMSCRPMSGVALDCPALPVHDSNNTSETVNTAMVFLTASMAANYTWTFWVW